MHCLLLAMWTAVLSLMPNPQMASAINQDLMKAAIGQLSESVKDRIGMIGIVGIVDDHGTSQLKTIIHLVQEMDAPMYMFNREQVTPNVRDQISLYESSGLAIWPLPEDSFFDSADELKNKLWTLDQNISGFKRCVTVVIDESRSLRKLFDKNQGRYQAPEKMHCHTVLMEHSRYCALIEFVVELQFLLDYFPLFLLGFSLLSCF